MLCFKFFSAATVSLSSTIALAVEYTCPQPHEINAKEHNRSFLELSAQIGDAKYAGLVRAEDFGSLKPGDLRIGEFELMTYFQKPGPTKKQTGMTCQYKMRLKDQDVSSPMNIIGYPSAPFNCKAKNNSPMASAHNNVKVITCQGPNLGNCIFECP